jgi:hypothetical protein
VNTKPGIDHLKVGDEVVIALEGRHAENRLVPARITKTNRVWWEFEEIITGAVAWNRPRTWRMRKTTQREGDYRGEYYGNRFATAEQLRWEDRNHTAEQYLREIRVEVWQCAVIDKLTLANLIRTHLHLEEI